MTRAPTPWQGRLPGYQPIPWRVRVMVFESISAMLGDVARLLMQVERSTDPDEREAAAKKLWVAYSTIEADLKDAERDVSDGKNRRFEVAVYRSALTTLGDELAALGLVRPGAPS